MWKLTLIVLFILHHVLLTSVTRLFTQLYTVSHKVFNLSAMNCKHESQFSNWNTCVTVLKLEHVAEHLVVIYTVSRHTDITWIAIILAWLRKISCWLRCLLSSSTPCLLSLKIFYDRRTLASDNCWMTVGPTFTTFQLTEALISGTVF